MNRREFLNGLELEEKISSMGDRELSEFIARQVYDVCALSSSNERRIVNLENRGARFISLIGAAGAFIGGIIVAVINYFTGR